jgi:hypothetical protein
MTGRAVGGSVLFDLSNVVQIQGRIDVLEDPTAKSGVFFREFLQLPEGIPVVNEHPGDRFRVSFGNARVVALVKAPEHVSQRGPAVEAIKHCIGSRAVWLGTGSW